MSFSLPATLPTALRTVVDHHLAQWLGAVHEAGLESRLGQLGDAFMGELQQVLAGSDFVAEQLRRDPGMAWRLTEDGRLWRSLAAGEMASLLAQALADAATEEQLAQRLRRFRQQHQVRIIWRDLTRQAPTMETTWDLSDMADACLEQAYQWVYRELASSFGTPLSHAGEQQHMVVLGMEIGRASCRERV